MTGLEALVWFYGSIVAAGVVMVWLSAFRIERLLRNIEIRIDQLLKEHLEP